MMLFCSGISHGLRMIYEKIENHLSISCCRLRKPIKNGGIPHLLSYAGKIQNNWAAGFLVCC